MSDLCSATPEEAAARCPLINWQGTVWRFHKRKYPALDPAGSRLTAGRFHRPAGQDKKNDGWQALYCALSPETCLGEILRNTPPELMPGLNLYRLSEIEVDLESIIDCRPIATFGIPIEELIRDRAYDVTQRIARAALRTGAQGILVPSATRLGDNLVIFPDNLRPESRLEVIASRDPVLYVEKN